MPETKQPWNVEAGRKWVVVAFWGEDTTVTFCKSETEANEAYDDAVMNGADVFSGNTKRMCLQSEQNK